MLPGVNIKRWLGKRLCSVVWCSAADKHLKQLDHVLSGAQFLTGECDIEHATLTLFVVPNGRCTLFMVLYLDRMCQCRLHSVLWSHIGILMPRLAAEPRSTTRFLFRCQYRCGTILVTPYSTVWNCNLHVILQEQIQYLFIGLAARSVLTFSSFIRWVSIV